MVVDDDDGNEDDVKYGVRSKVRSVQQRYRVCQSVACIYHADGTTNYDNNNDNYYYDNNNDNYYY